MREYPRDKWTRLLGNLMAAMPDSYTFEGLDQGGRLYDKHNRHERNDLTWAMTARLRLLKSTSRMTGLSSQSDLSMYAILKEKYLDIPVEEDWTPKIN